jgi:Uma2 family endonuclease
MWPVGNPDNSLRLMARVQPDHNRIKHNVEMSLGNQLENTPCEVMSGDQQVRVEDSNLNAFPDVVVVCENARFEDVRGLGTLFNPVVIVEVLSPSTEFYDRTDKWAHYQRLSSLCDYIVIFSDQMRVEHHARDDQNQSWTEMIFFRPDEQVELRDASAALRIGDLYRRVSLSSTNTSRMPRLDLSQ